MNIDAAHTTLNARANVYAAIQAQLDQIDPESFKYFASHDRDKRNATIILEAGGDRLEMATNPSFILRFEPGQSGFSIHLHPGRQVLDSHRAYFRMEDRTDISTYLPNDLTGPEVTAMFAAVQARMPANEELTMPARIAG